MTMLLSWRKLSLATRAMASRALSIFSRRNFARSPTRLCLACGIKVIVLTSRRHTSQPHIAATDKRCLEEETNILNPAIPPLNGATRLCLACGINISLHKPSSHQSTTHRCHRQTMLGGRDQHSKPGNPPPEWGDQTLPGLWHQH